MSGGGLSLSDFVQEGLEKLKKDGIVPTYDGFYDDENGTWDSWEIINGNHLYYVDRNRSTGQLHCTCKGFSDYSKPCKHMALWWETACRT